MNAEVLLPQSAAVQSFAAGIVVGGLLFGIVAAAWAHAHGWAVGWDAGHAEGWVKGVKDAGVLERLVALDEQDVEQRRAAGMRRHRPPVAEWRKELRWQE